MKTSDDHSAIDLTLIFAQACGSHSLVQVPVVVGVEAHGKHQGRPFHDDWVRSAHDLLPRLQILIWHCLISRHVDTQRSRFSAATPITAQGCHAVENPDSHPNTIGHSVVDVGNCTQLKFHFVRARRGYTQLLFELDPETGYPVPQLSTKTLVSVSNCSFGQGMPLQDANGLRIIVRENKVQLIGHRNASTDPFETVPPRVITVWCFVSPHVTFVSPNIGNGNPVEHAAALPHRQPLEFWATRDRSLSTSSSSQLHDELFVMVAEIESPAMWQMQLMQHSQYVSQFDALLGGFPPGFGENGADIYFGQYGYTSGRTPWLSQLIAPSPDRPPSDQAMSSKNLHALVLALVTNPGAVNCRQRYLRQLIRAVEMFNATVDSFGEVLPHNTPPPNFPHRGDYLEGQEFVTKYLFVWAVENSNCKGYITEKSSATTACWCRATSVCTTGRW